MATQVLIAHTGQRLQVDTTRFSSIDEFKASVSKQTSIPLPHLVALTPHGKGVKLQTIREEAEIYIYDRNLTQADPSDPKTPSVPELPNPKRYAVPKAPDYIDDTHDMSSWQKLCLERRAWALGIADDCARLATAARERYGEMDVMIKCLDAAVVNLEHSVKQIEPKYAELKKWAAPALEEHVRLAANWEKCLSVARSVPISAAMVKFMTGKDIKRKQATLDDLLELDTAKKAGSLAATSERKFGEKVQSLDKAANTMYRGLEQLISEFDGLVSRSALTHSGEADQLLQDIEAVAKKIHTDAQMVQEYTNRQRDLSQASKAAQNQTERLLPTLKRRAQEMDDMVHYATEARNAIAADSVRCMRSITGITSLHSNVKSQMNILNQSEEDMATFDYLRLIHQLPYMYASFVSEAIRRREWAEKIKTDSSTLANEMALFQDEEAKRRRRWHKMVGSTYGPEESGTSILGLEVNLLGEEEEWPNMSKVDLEEFLDHLRQKAAEAAIVEEVSKLAQELKGPTKQQSKRLKAFKNGSIHEAALGRSGLMIRGDDELLRSLQDDKSKLENKVKTAESRVRRLEDLLHRSQTSRPSLGSLFGHERNDSTYSLQSPTVANSDDRRFSSTGIEFHQQRIRQLENELGAEKERSAALEKELGARTTQHDDMKGRMEEVNSTKKDLLGNMEALKREFTEERKSLEAEIKLLKARIEDNEDEMEHLGESREHEKATYDQRVAALEHEIHRLRKEKQDETLKSQGQVEFLRNEMRLQRERNGALERSVETITEENKALSSDLLAAQDASKTQLGALRDLHDQLCSDDGTDAPADAADLIDVLASRAAEVVSRLRITENDMSALKSDYDRSQEHVQSLKSELAETQERLTAEEDSARRLRESLSEEKARVAALEKDREDGRSQLSQLRARLSDGETGSESMRKRLDEEERRVTAMSEELALKQSQVGSLSEELRLSNEKLHKSQGRVTDLTGRLDARTERAKDLTQRLYAQNDRLCRLLERLGFAISREGSSMTIQKVPRSERGSMSQTQHGNDSFDPNQSSSVRRSVTLGSRALADSADLELLYWTNSTEEEDETEKYEAFVSQLGSFDMDLVSETVYRRVKDVEHLARKLQRDARAYREKARTLQKEAHEKIAYKHFKEGDLALFLPTRNQASGAWAAFNVGFPHYFLREQDGHRLRSREWLVARITRIEERVVDLSKTLHKQQQQQAPDPDAASSANGEEDDNPFQLSDGLRWYMIDAHEDKAGAPSTPGLGKSTTAANNVEARADMHLHAHGHGGGAGGRDKRTSVHSIEGVSKVLTKSLESRRSSSNSKKALPFSGAGLLKGNAVASETNSIRAAASETPLGTSPPAQDSPVLITTTGPPGDGTEGMTNASSPQKLGGGSARQPTAAPDEGSSASKPAASSISEVRNDMDTLLGP
ncbi:hypothetical protein SODALDRAFT_286560 [Sodiomyces alkalinus F11]|uniref:Autophagy-related protein 11 n=1 Tax=Sodiomyces alkalinus (strain CBS 110278 / VKM F-3762 / F11) TaxID=1314773 RepID=A0A3N2PIR7_SODAK|nr:hypothetical protein SODALDRAFT_286560 [Sodiomyces alkalinus F11]ROT34451.1 hypothetical protein SODALDRAFT_286560 [Sodiomyces alkalinus F11]